MRMYDIIEKKRDGFKLTDEEIRFFISGVTSGEIPDYETTALLMAIYLKGMDERETATLTDAMANSGGKIDLSPFGDLTVDKHSTGGVGDKTTLIVAPIVASLGAKVAKMSGRGLGHTGGTVDKLESIPGYQTSLPTEKFYSQVEEIGIAVVGQSGELAPADKKLYALRDVTATVSNISLIASSIMSKKIAAGSKNIVLDVKVGAGAFMKTYEDAALLASTMVDIGKKCNRRICAVLTSMDSPLGNAIGNSVEVIEAVNVLQGKSFGVLRDVCEALATEMVTLSLGISPEEAAQKVRHSIDSGTAFEKMKEWVANQGGDVRYLDDTTLFPTAKYSQTVVAHTDGYITKIDAEKLGSASMILGAGRKTKDDVIDLSAGVILSATVSDHVKKGDVICTLLTNDKSKFNDAKKKILEGIFISDELKEESKPIYGIIR